METNLACADNFDSLDVYLFFLTGICAYDRKILDLEARLKVSFKSIRESSFQISVTPTSSKKWILSEF